MLPKGKWCLEILLNLYIHSTESVCVPLGLLYNEGDCEQSHRFSLNVIFIIRSVYYFIFNI